MQPGAGRSQVVRVNATVTYDGATVPMGINLAEVSTTRELVTGTDQRALTVVMRAGDKVLLIGDEAERFERAWRGEMTPGNGGDGGDGGSGDRVDADDHRAATDADPA